jgi:MFS family permease
VLAASPGTPAPYVLAVAQLIFGLGMTSFSVTQISLRQAMTPPRLLGRVNATRRVLVFGVQPLGALVGGALGEWRGLYTALALAAALQIVCFLATVLSPLRTARETPAG